MAVVKALLESSRAGGRPVTVAKTLVMNSSTRIRSNGPRTRQFQRAAEVFARGTGDVIRAVERFSSSNKHRFTMRAVGTLNSWSDITSCTGLTIETRV